MHEIVMNGTNGSPLLSFYSIVWLITTNSNYYFLPHGISSQDEGENLQCVQYRLQILHNEFVYIEQVSCEELKVGLIFDWVGTTTNLAHFLVALEW